MPVTKDLNRYAHLGAVKQGGAEYYGVRYQGGVIVEGADGTGAAGVYTLRFPLPAKSRIIDLGSTMLVLWGAGTSASMIVGDDADDNGFFTATDLKATDLLVGETNNIEHPGNLAGAYIASEQRLLYSAGPRAVIFQVTTSGNASTQGRTHCYVVYAVDTDPTVGYVAS